MAKIDSTDQSEPSKDDKEQKRLWLWALAAVCFVIGLWLITFLSFTFLSHFRWFDVGDRGTFGDMFGGLNSLFSGLAFAGIVFTILLQRIELKYQREELRLTRETLKDQKDEMEAQNETLRLQSFENTFFSLLKLRIDHISEIQYDTGAKRGRTAFNAFNEDLIYSWKMNPNKTYDGWNHTLHCWYADQSASVSPYFQMLYHTFKLIEDSHITNKQKYFNFLRSQLSGEELILIFYAAIVLLEKTNIISL